MTQRSLGLRISVFMLALIVLLAGVGVAISQQPAKPPAAGPDLLVPSIDRLSIKAFKLSLCDPQDLNQLVQGLLGPLPEGLNFGGNFLGGPFQSVTPLPQMINPFLPSDLNGDTARRKWRAAVDPRTQVLLVRGTEKELQMVEELIAALELPADTARPQTKRFLIYHLKNAKADALISLLHLDAIVNLSTVATANINILDPQVRLAGMASGTVLVACGPDEALKDMGDAIKKLDVPSVAKAGNATRVFPLKLCDPDEVARALAILLNTKAGQDDPALGPGPIGGMGGRRAGMAPVTGDVDDGVFRVVVSNRTRSLVIRGSDMELRIATDLIAVLESPAEKPIPKVKSLSVFSLKHAEADELEPVLTRLDLEVRLLALPAAKLLIATGVEDHLKSLADIVRELDVPAPEEPKVEKKKRLFRQDRSEDQESGSGIGGIGVIHG